MRAALEENMKAQGAERVEILIVLREEEKGAIADTVRKNARRKCDQVMNKLMVRRGRCSRKSRKRDRGEIQCGDSGTGRRPILEDNRGERFPKNLEIGDSRIERSKDHGEGGTAAETEKT